MILWWLYGREKIGPEYPNILLKKYAYIPLRIRFLWIIRGCIFICLLLLWIDPQISREKILRKENGKQIILTLDVSNSMKADDIKPSRLERAKEVIDTFLHQDRTDAIGYIIFAGRTFLLSPLSYDRDGIWSIVTSTSTDTIDQSQPDTSGTNIGDAIMASISTFWNETSTWKQIIVLITDGRANIGISPLQAAAEASKKNINIYTIGIWSASWEVLSYMDNSWSRRYFYDTSGNKVLADIDESTLRTIAEKTWGRYFHAENLSLLEDIFSELDTIISSPIVYTNENTFISLSPIIELIMIVSLLAHGVVSASVRRKYKCM